jgi:hypothetical protein
VASLCCSLSLPLTRGNAERMVILPCAVVHQRQCATTWRVARTDIEIGVKGSAWLRSQTTNRWIRRATVRKGEYRKYSIMRQRALCSVLAFSPMCSRRPAERHPRTVVGRGAVTPGLCHNLMDLKTGAQALCCSVYY